MRRAGIRWRRRTENDGLADLKIGHYRLAGAAEGVDPGGEEFVVGGFEVEKFDAHADAGLDDANGDQGFEHLPLASEFHARTGTKGQRLTGADKTSTQGEIGSDSGDLLAGFQVDEFRIGSEGETDGVATVTDSADGGFGTTAVGHGDNFAQSWHPGLNEAEEARGRIRLRHAVILPEPLTIGNRGPAEGCEKVTLRDLPPRVVISGYDIPTRRAGPAGNSTW